ncbi:hypothetical protein H5410_061639 [Solanum commersonii]|uniref:Uncharacterized protein n=1 Tax=Solanum commersonii TaxID=4109 RepID=A0A9J5W8J9_SOLCO|nr:hypothetical protein H5410_061639 [Solanum commersonii]
MAEKTMKRRPEDRLMHAANHRKALSSPKEKIKSAMKRISWRVAEQFRKAVLYRPLIHNVKMLKARAERR